MTPAPSVLFEEYLERLERTATAAESWTATQEFFQALGFDWAMYGTAGRGNDPRPVVMNNFPDWFVQRYLEQDYIRDDPVVAVCASQMKPRIVGANALAHWDLGSFNERAMQITDEAREFGYSAGILFPLHTPDRSRFGGVSFVTGMPIAEFERYLPEVRPFLNLAAWYLHARIQLQLTMEAAEAVHLTGRERECLLWAAHGLSSKETARKLSVTPQAVDFHVLNACKKLGATNRVHAVARALALGILAL